MSHTTGSITFCLSTMVSYSLSLLINPSPFFLRIPSVLIHPPFTSTPTHPLLTLFSICAYQYLLTSTPTHPLLTIFFPFLFLFLSIFIGTPLDLFDLAMVDTLRAYPRLSIQPFRDMIAGMYIRTSLNSFSFPSGIKYETTHHMT